MANQIHGFTIDYGKFILITDIAMIWMQILTTYFIWQVMVSKENFNFNI